MDKQISNSIPNKVIYEIFPHKELEKSPAAFSQTLDSLTHLQRGSLFSRLTGRIENISFEIAVINTKIHFFAIIPQSLSSYFESQISTSYPDSTFQIHESDYLPQNIPNIQIAQLQLANVYYLPLRTYKNDEETDPLSPVLGTMSKALQEDLLVFQINLANGGNWQSYGQVLIDKGIQVGSGEDVQTKAHPQAALITEKISHNGFEASMRLFSASPDAERAKSNLANLQNSFGTFSLSGSNSLKIKKPSTLGKSKLISAFYMRSFNPRKKNTFLNTEEVATLFHLPDIATSQIKNVGWGGEAFNEPPQNLPVALEASEEDKQHINFFARTEFKNQSTTFGIKDGDDRRRHFYIIGKTGTGKSTLIANMAISDIRKGHGVAVVDPHGDLSEILLDYIPSRRINEVAYLDPSRTDRTFRINPLQVDEPEEAEVVTSGIVSIFQKLYSYSWGPRLEYILRNTVLTLVRKQGSTMLDIPRILANDGYRKAIVDKLDDDILREFWKKEYDQYTPQFRQEAIAPILNKVGQFLSSNRTRNILGFEKSTIDLEEVMNEGKILILNLSQGRLGEDNSSLLGALFITQFQLAAMNRVDIPEAQRRDFYLYVDEFQNFATTSFIKILSEARKYHLNLILANQYMAQLSEDIQKAILGNVGSTVSFTLGAADASVLSAEFGSAFEEDDLVALGRFQIATKLSIDNMTSQPFLAHTLPLPKSINKNRDKIVKQSLERFTKPIAKKAQKLEDKKIRQYQKTPDTKAVQQEKDIPIEREK